MGFWFNNFVEFERFQKKENRLVLNFYYSPDVGEKPKSVKVYVKKNVTIPSGFLPDVDLEKLEAKLGKHEILKDFPLKKKRVGRFNVVELELPNNPEILHELDSRFQVGNYDRLVRYSGFFPERKVNLDQPLVNLFEENEEVELTSLRGVSFGQFPNVEELASLPSIYIDIEKPLWKNDQEKRWIDARKKLLKRERKYAKSKDRDNYNDRLHEKRVRAIKGLEDRLTIDVEGVGKVALYDDRFDADISFITTIWKSNDKLIKEIYVLDPHGEVRQEQEKDYRIYRFGTEKELVRNLIDKLHERKPIISYGHNQVYDITQIRFAADEAKETFDPAIKDVRPRRDFVRSFLQRLREDLIYFDSLWLANVHFPYLKQKRFGTSLKLAAVAQHRGINFKKSLTHEELRFVELRRLAGVDKQIRDKARDEMLSYAADDVDATFGIIGTIDFMPLVLRIKDILPYCTLSEIAFSPNCMHKLHENRHFQRVGNLPYHGYRQKERQNEVQIFKKRFNVIKGRMLNWAGLEKAKKGEYEDVKEFYLPLEEWLKDFAFHVNPELAIAYRESEDDRFAFLQYLKSFLRDPLVDYYFARREAKNYDKAREFLKMTKDEAFEAFHKMPGLIQLEELNQLNGSFRFLKNHFRSVYMALEGKNRGIIRPTKKRVEEINFPPIMEADVDLFLLREHADQVREHLSEKNARLLDSFLNNFNRFEEVVKLVGEKVVTSYDKRDFLYTYVCFDRAQAGDKRFYARYGFQVRHLTELLANVYRNFAREMGAGALVAHQGDYIFTQEVDNLPSAYKIRDINRFEVK